MKYCILNYKDLYHLTPKGASKLAVETQRLPDFDLPELEGVKLHRSEERYELKDCKEPLGESELKGLAWLDSSKSMMGQHEV